MIKMLSGTATPVHGESRENDESRKPNALEVTGRPGMPWRREMARWRDGQMARDEQDDETRT